MTTTHDIVRGGAFSHSTSFGFHGGVRDGDVRHGVALEGAELARFA